MRRSRLDIGELVTSWPTASIDSSKYDENTRVSLHQLRQARREGVDDGGHVFDPANLHEYSRERCDLRGGSEARHVRGEESFEQLAARRDARDVEHGDVINREIGDGLLAAAGGQLDRQLDALEQFASGAVVEADHRLDGSRAQRGLIDAIAKRSVQGAGGGAVAGAALQGDSFLCIAGECEGFFEKVVLQAAIGDQAGLDQRDERVGAEFGRDGGHASHGDDRLHVASIGSGVVGFFGRGLGVECQTRCARGD